MHTGTCEILVLILVAKITTQRSQTLPRSETPHQSRCEQYDSYSLQFPLPLCSNLTKIISGASWFEEGHARVFHSMLPNKTLTTLLRMTCNAEFAAIKRAFKERRSSGRLSFSVDMRVVAGRALHREITRPVRE